MSRIILCDKYTLYDGSKWHLKRRYSNIQTYHDDVELNVWSMFIKMQSILKILDFMCANTLFSNEKNWIPRSYDS